MKRILIAPHFMQAEKVHRVSVFSDLSDFLLDQGFLPELAFFHTRHGSLQEAKNLAQKYLIKDKIDGLILHGGSDVSAFLYSSPASGSCTSNIFRDYFELALINLAIDYNIPIFGICRGMQILNVYFKGSLKNITSNKKYHIQGKKKNFKKIDDINKVDLDYKHIIQLEDNKWLSKILSQKQILVNSAHSQKIDKLAHNFEIIAKTEDEVIESIIDFDKKILATQWHPELDLKDPNNLKIMTAWLEWTK
jgi:putative glutamine amidotransferase